MSRAAILFVVTIQFMFAPIVFAQSTEMVNGLSYLTSAQNPDGSWGTDISKTEVLPSTVAAIETLQVLNQTGTSHYSNAVTWLQSQGLDLSDYLSERIHALSIAGTDMDLLLSYIDELEYVWGVYADFGVNNLDTALALRALKKINYSDQNTIDNALSYLVSSQKVRSGYMGYILFQVHRLHFSPHMWIAAFHLSMSYRHPFNHISDPEIFLKKPSYQ